MNRIVSPAAGEKQAANTPLPRMGIAACMVVGVLVAGCGGGGGGGSAAAIPPQPEQQPVSAISLLPPVTASAEELHRSSYIAQSGAKTAWDQGYGGLGVTVAVVDSGIAGQLDEFAGRIHPASGNYTDSNQGVQKNQPVTDDEGHGTLVASVLAAAANGQNTVGIAPQTTVLALGFYSAADVNSDGTFSVNLQRLSNAFADSRSAGASVVNGSFTLSGDHAAMRTALQQSVAAGQVLVFAAGNEAQANPALPARYAKETWANGQIIAVGAVDRNNVMTAYSNRAGDTMNFYLVARGDVQAVDERGRLVSVSGTSFAAPQVAGAAALLKQKWPQLSGTHIAEVLFTSATDLGAPGVDPIYGQGLLNIDRAMQPIGSPTIAVAGGGAVPVEATSLALPANALGAALARLAGKGALTVAATDRFGRDFKTDLAARIRQTTPSALLELQQQAMGDMDALSKRFGPIRFRYTPPVSDVQTAGGSVAGSFFADSDVAGWQFAGGTGDRLQRFFGVESHVAAKSQPFLNLASDGWFVGTGFEPLAGARLRAGTVRSASSSGQMLDFAYGNRNRMAAPLKGDWEVAVTGGEVGEKNRLLGMNGTGALAFGSGRSNFTTLGGRYWLSSDMDVGASYTYGRTAANRVGLLQFSPIAIEAAEAHLSKSGVFGESDRIEFSIAKPMVVRRGTLSTILPARVAEDGTLGFVESSINLAGGASETRFGVSYATAVGKQGRLSLDGLYRLDADNERGRREPALSLRYDFFYR